MSTAAISLPISPFSMFAPKSMLPGPARPTRRRTSPNQGRALEALGHAIEYLVDSRMCDAHESPADAEAVRLLMLCSREVFSECAVVQPWHHRVQKALMKALHAE